MRVAATKNILVFLLSVLIAAFLAASLLFQGHNGGWLVATQVLVLTGLFLALWGAYDQKIELPKTLLFVTVALYTGWLALTLFWSPVVSVSKYFFWWMTPLPLGFWLYLLLPEKEKIWGWVAVTVLAGAFALAVAGVVEAWMTHQRPKTIFLNVNSYGGLLNLLAVAAAGYWLLEARSPRSRRNKFVLGAFIFVCVVAIGLTRGRGVLIGMFLGLSILGWAAYRFQTMRAYAQMFAMVIAGLLTSILSSGGAAFERWAAAVASPVVTGFDRFLIWQGSWELLKESPWWGIGLGTYHLAWPPYRDPQDGTAGNFVHNDYLQIWIEGGLPALWLFLSVLISCAGLWWRVVKRKPNPRHENATLEITALFAAVAAVAVHSFFDFNFYVVTTLLLTGLMMGRLQSLSMQALALPRWTVELQRRFTPLGYRSLLTLLALFPLLYFSTLSLSVFETRRAVKFAQAGNFEQAELHLLRAARYYPEGDATYMSLADLYREARLTLPVEAREKRQDLFVRADRMLDRAQSLNPLRVQTLLVRAQLYQQNPELPADRVRAVYERAIALNPRDVEARYRYAQFLLTQKLTREAQDVLEAGFRYSYPSHRGHVPYYELAMVLRHAAGDEKGAAKLAQDIRDIMAVSPSP
jgi:O-antigen ligase